MKKKFFLFLHYNSMVRIFFNIYILIILHEHSYKHVGSLSVIFLTNYTYRKYYESFHIVFQ